MTATDMYYAAWNACYDSRLSRTTTDKDSPAQGRYLEAPLGMQFRVGRNNVVRCRETDLRWAAAYVLHFFAETEDGEVLRRYNRHAQKFLEANGTLVGAYGAIAMPGIRRCVSMLEESPDTRRAVVTMDWDGVATINKPACWTSLHFLKQNEELHLLVYQRSLSLGVLPYDAILLSNIHEFVAEEADMALGDVVWTVGSLHAKAEHMPVSGRPVAATQLYLSPDILAYPEKCLEALDTPDKYGLEVMK